MPPQQPDATSEPFPRIVPLVIATALFMENLDSSVISTSLPEIAQDLGSHPIHLKLALTSYLLALAVFIPASGWAADRFGARLIFRIAISVFALGSIACGMANSLGTLVAARVLQGIGGAMMTPVGRLIILRSVPKSMLVSALAWLTIPALLGPVMGPPIGGFITTYIHWRWIFWINIPIAFLGIVLASLYIPDIRAEDSKRFDWLGFLLVGPGLAFTLTGATLAGLNLAPPIVVAALCMGGPVLLMLYTWHALTVPAPLVDLRLMALPTFRINVIGGTLFRIGVGATPFLLPLMLQLGFGFTPFQSGMITFSAGIGALFMKFMAQPLLVRFGFRRILMANAVLASLSAMIPALFSPATPWLMMVGLLFLGGLSRSLQFTSVNAVAYADVPPERMSSATSFSSVLQQLSGSLGVTVAALGLETMQARHGGPLALADFHVVFIAIGCLAMTSLLSFRTLTPQSGRSLIGKDGG